MEIKQKMGAGMKTIPTFYLQYEVQRKFIIHRLKSKKHGADYSGIYDLINRMKVNLDVKISIKGIKYIGPMEEFFTSPAGLYEAVDTNETLKNILSSKV